MGGKTSRGDAKHQQYLNDIERAAKQGARLGYSAAWRTTLGILCIVLCDNYNVTHDDLQDLLCKVYAYADAIDDSKVGLKMHDVFDTLRKEYQIEIQPIPTKSMRLPHRILKS